MKRALAAAFFVTGLAGGGAGLCADAGSVKVYDAGELPPNRYTVIKRLWTQDWQSMFWLPTYTDAGSAVSVVTKEAAALGADGVVNLNCVKDGRYYCYALAIKLR